MGGSGSGQWYRWDKRRTLDDLPKLDIRRGVPGTVPIVYQPCHYGGYRYWFQCPQCQGRCAVLYRYSGLWQCRRCVGLRYKTQHVSRLDRLYRRIHRLRDQLQAGWNLTEPIWQKPKRMHLRTFERLWQEEQVVHAAIVQALGAELRRLERKTL